MEKKRNIKGIVFDVVLLVLSAFLCLGTKFIFHACGPMEDGKWMTCHWAEQAVFGVSLAITAIALVLVIVRNRKIKTGLAIAMIPTSIVSAIIPKVLINLCMMSDMRCHSVMRPAVIVTSAIIAITALVYAIVNSKSAE